MNGVMRWVVPDDMGPSLLDRVALAFEESRLYASGLRLYVANLEAAHEETVRRVRWLAMPPCTECGMTVGECDDNIQCCRKCWHYR